MARIKNKLRVLISKILISKQYLTNGQEFVTGDYFKEYLVHLKDPVAFKYPLLKQSQTAETMILPVTVNLHDYMYHFNNCYTIIKTITVVEC